MEQRKTLKALTGVKVRDMDLQRIAAGFCAVVGTALLVGLGWAFLVAALFLFVVPKSSPVTVVWQRMRWMFVVPPARRRQMYAATAMPLALIAVAIGVTIAYGPGWGLVVGGVAVASLSLYVDRQA